jgi:GNAT superfamily N-acetyltransferase
MINLTPIPDLIQEYLEMDLDISEMDMKDFHVSDITDVCNKRYRLLKGFTCSNEDLEKYLQNQAEREHTGNMCNTKVVEYKGAIIAFFSMKNTAIFFKPDLEVEEQVSVPAIELSRLAVKAEVQSKGIGSLILKFIIGAAYHYSGFSAAKFIVLDSVKNSVGFYTKYGFIEFEPSYELLGNHSDDCVPMYYELC